MWVNGLIFSCLLFSISQANGQEHEYYFSDQEIKGNATVIDYVKGESYVVLCGTRFGQHLKQPNFTMVDSSGKVLWNSSDNDELWYDKDIDAVASDVLIDSAQNIYGLINYGDSFDFIQLNPSNGKALQRKRHQLSCFQLGDYNADYVFVAGASLCSDSCTLTVSLINKVTGKVDYLDTTRVRHIYKFTGTATSNRSGKVFVSYGPTIYKIDPIKGKVDESIYFEKVDNFEKAITLSNNNVVFAGGTTSYSPKVVSIDAGSKVASYNLPSKYAISVRARQIIQRDSSFYIIWNRRLSGSGHSSFWCTKHKDANGEQVWDSHTAIGGLSSSNSYENPNSIDIDNNHGVYINGVYKGDSWGFVKINSETGASEFVKQVTVTSSNFDDKNSRGEVTAVFNNKVLLIGQYADGINSSWQLVSLLADTSKGNFTIVDSVLGNHRFRATVKSLVPIGGGRIAVLKQVGRGIEVGVLKGDRVLWEKKVFLRERFAQGSDLVLTKDSNLAFLCLTSYYSSNATYNFESSRIDTFGICRIDTNGANFGRYNAPKLPTGGTDEKIRPHQLINTKGSDMVFCYSLERLRLAKLVDSSFVYDQDLHEDVKRYSTSRFETFQHYMLTRPDGKVLLSNIKKGATGSRNTYSISIDGEPKLLDRGERSVGEIIKHAIPYDNTTFLACGQRYSNGGSYGYVARINYYNLDTVWSKLFSIRDEVVNRIKLSADVRYVYTLGSSEVGTWVRKVELNSRKVLWERECKIIGSEINMGLAFEVNENTEDVAIVGYYIDTKGRQHISTYIFDKYGNTRDAFTKTGNARFEDEAVAVVERDELFIVGGRYSNSNLGQDGFLFNFKPSVPLVAYHQTKEESNVQLYPNPASGTAYLEVTEEFNQDCIVRITDMIGQTCFEQSYALKAGKNVIELDLSEIVDGNAFILHMTDEKGMVLCSNTPFLN